MRSNRSADTKPEVQVRSLLHRAGFRFQKNRTVKVGATSIRTDLTFPTERLVVFIDGCFWHGCDKHCRIPHSNREYWTAKIKSNAERDARNTRILASNGWTVLRAWEHAPPYATAVAVGTLLVE